MRHHEQDEFTKFCLRCKSPYLYTDWLNSTDQRCNNCKRHYSLIKCSNCHVKPDTCPKCLIAKESQQEIDSKTETVGWKCSPKYILLMAGLIAPCFGWILKSGSQEVPDVMERLKMKFPSQKNETFYHILSVLERTKPTVKSITLLHRNHMKTSNCLAEELVNIFDKNVNINEVSFDIDGVKFRDYGEIFEHYHSVVQKFGVLVTNLNKVPGSIARVFHSLCDEVASDIKPSLFIFILREKKETNMRPLEKATTILKQAWEDLPDSHLFPLLSRVLKNVVDVIPEKNAAC